MRQKCDERRERSTKEPNRKEREKTMLCCRGKIAGALVDEDCLVLLRNRDVRNERSEARCGVKD